MGYQHPIKDGVIGRCWRQIKQGELLNAFGNLLTIIFFGWFIIDIYNYFKLRELPDFDDPKIQAWPTPLPPEQWAKPSENLIETIRQQEQKLMGEGNYKAEDCQYYQPQPTPIIPHENKNLCPPLVPAGKDYADNAIFGRKNTVYLDICVAYMVETIFCYSWAFTLITLIIGYLINWDIEAFLVFFVLPQMIFIPVAIYIVFKSVPLPDLLI